MAEIEKIFELEIGVEQAYQDVAKMRERVNELTNEMSELKKATGNATPEYAKLSAELTIAKQELKQTETITKALVLTEQKQADTIEVLKAKLAATTIEWNKYTAAELEENEEGIKVNQQKLELTETLKKLEKQTGDYRREVGHYENATKNLKQELKELKGIMLNSQEGTEQYNDALKRAAQITDDLGDMQERIKGTAMGFEDVMGNVVKVGSGVASAYEAAQGAMALFGNESEELQKAMLKVQAAIALANGLQGLEGMGKSFKNLLTQIKIFASGTKKALIATGIGAFVVLLGSIYAYWDDIKEAVTGVSKEHKKLLNDATKNLEVEKEKLDSIDAQDNILKLQGKSEKQILEIKLKQIQSVIARSKEEIHAQMKINKLQVEAEARNQQILLKMVEPLRVALAMIDDTVSKLGRLIGKKWDLGLRDIPKSMTELVFDPEEAKQKGDELLKEQEKTLAELENKYAGYQLEINSINNKASSDSKKKKDDQLNEELERIQKRTDAELDAAKTLEENYKAQAEIAVKYFDDELAAYKATQRAKGETLQSRLQTEIQLEQEVAKAKLENGLISEQEYYARVVELRDMQATETAELNRQARELEATSRYDAMKNEMFAELDLQRQALDEKYLLEIEFAESIGADTTYIEKKYSDARKEINRIEQDAKLKLASDFMGNIATIAGEGTAIGKAAAVAQTTIDTYKAAQGAYASLAGIPIIGPVLGATAAAAAIVSGLANIKKILAVDSGLPGDNAKGGGGGSTPSVPNVPQSGNVAASVNNGIISRESTKTTQEKITLQPTLVIDSVTSKQNKDLANNNTSLL